MKTTAKYLAIAALTAVIALPVAAKAAETKAPMAAPAPAAMSFQSLDVNHDKELTLGEFEKAFKHGDSKVKEEFASLDKNRDHKLNAAEYAGTVKQM
jgi:hypothetical protein